MKRFANAPLVGQIAFTNGGVQRMVTSKSYDNLNRLTQIASAPSASSAVTFSYAYNSANQRTAVTNADNSRWAYGYDTLGQVTSGRKYWNDATPVAGQQFEYNFDDIGNRKVTASGGDQYGLNLRSAGYTNNSLNQITSRTVPGYVNVIGEATNTAIVTLWSSSGAYATTSRKGDYFRGELAETNTSGALWLTITNLAVLSEGTNQAVVTNVVGDVFLAQTPETFGYDADGNLTNDGRWSLTWDAENRLVNMTSLSSGPAGSKLKLDFSYDYQSRRIEKIVSAWNGSSYVAQSTNRFVYDGWNLIAILDPQSSILQSFMWGLDLSGTMQGAGGVGGLLAVSDSVNGVQFVCYDGNGNVTALVKASDGTVSANYEYGPFGELVRATGLMAKSNPFRFSTKYQDDESDLLYYGYRSYNPTLGRWLSRDPIGEEGFYVLASAARLDFGPEDEKDKHNPYAFVQNRPLGAFDGFGLQTTASCNPLCGPDVTRPLQRLVLKVYSTWNSWTPAQQKAACKGLTSRDPDPTRGGGPAWLNAWDIDMLFNKGWINAAPYCPPCATPQAQCRNTVQVGNQCYYAGSANYVLFGHMASLCGWPKWKMTVLIWGYKGPKPPFSGGAPNYTTSRDWAIAGYDGWPAGSATPPSGDRPKCNPACPVAYSGPAFRFYWYPHGWN